MGEKYGGEVIPAQEFKHAMSFVNGFLEVEKNIQNKLITLDFILEVVKEDLKTDLLSYIFYSKTDFSRQLTYPFPLHYSDRQGVSHSLKQKEAIDVDLAHDCVLVLPWRRDRLYKQITNLFHNNFSYDSRNHKAYYYPYVSLCYVYNGNHSIASGVVHKKGSIKAERYDITELFPHIYTDGQSWYNTHTNEKAGDVTDFRISIIYEIAKAKHQLEKS